MSTSLEPVTQTEPPKSDKPPAKKTAVDMISGLPGTITALIVAVTGAITAYTNYQEQQAVSKVTYEALKQATDRNTEQLTALSFEIKRNQDWTRSIAAAVRELQQKAPAPEKQVIPPAPPESMLDEPPAQPSKLPSFDQLKKD